jgi:hypothetical protein
VECATEWPTALRFFLPTFSAAFGEFAAFNGFAFSLPAYLSHALLPSSRDCPKTDALREDAQGIATHVKG